MTIRPEAVRAAELAARDVFEMWRWAKLDHNESREFFTGILEAAAHFMHAGAKIVTEEDLNALPIGTVVLSDEVTHHEGGWQLSYQRWQDGDWHRGARSGSTHPDNFLPVTVLHRPTDAV